MLDLGAGSWIYVHKNYIKDSKVIAEALSGYKPQIRHTVKMMGKDVQIPRYQQAFGKSYTYTGNTSQSIPFIPILDTLKKDIVDQMKQVLPDLDPTLFDYNMALVNWYEDGTQYIGPHSDDTKQLVKDSTIGSITIGASRDFVLTPKKGIDGKSVKISLDDGDFVIMGGKCQDTHLHSVPKRLKCKSERINITFRVFA